MARTSGASGARRLVYNAPRSERRPNDALPHLQEVVALKWSPNSAKIGILSDNDTLTLIEVQTGERSRNWRRTARFIGALLWTLDLKLRYFVDISVVDEEL